MNRRARTVLLAGFFFALSWNTVAAKQVVMRPTPAPTITAENEVWYLSGEPISYAGNLYYPSGAQIFFNANEMVRSGFHLGIPLYARTTIEPFSLVFVPLAGGRMQPYERPRSGEIAGTAGSTPTTLPTMISAEEVSLQAAGPPSQTARVVTAPIYTPPPATPAIGGAAAGNQSSVPQTVGTTGRPTPPRHTRIGGRPQGTNAIFIEFQSDRWYPAGPAELIDSTRMARLGDYAGFDVWAERAGSSTIYVPVTRGAALAVPYTRTRGR